MTERQAAILAAFEQTKDVRDVATRTGTSVVYVWKVLRRAGVRLPSDERRVVVEIVAGLSNDMGLRDAQRVFGISWQSIQRARIRLGIRRPRGRPRSELPLDLIADMRAKGHSWRDIGEVLGRHPDRVRRGYQMLFGNVG